MNVMFTGECDVGGFTPVIGIEAAENEASHHGEVSAPGLDDGVASVKSWVDVWRE